jgi:two-component system, NtrC family, sensor kinase
MTMRLSRKIMLAVSAIIVLANLALVSLIGWRYEVELRDGLTESARSYYKLIVVVRSWVAENEGIYIRQSPGVEPNPYLADPLLVTAHGDSLVWRNPAMVTRELSELSRSLGGRVQFHLASLDPVNPANAPDDFEREALNVIIKDAHRRGPEVREFTQFEYIDGVRHFRYFAPLYTEGSCVSCHGQQGYDVGDVRGGISIRIPTDQFAVASSDSLLLTMVGGLVTSGLISLVLLGIIQHSVIRPLRRLENAAREIGSGNYHTEILTGSEDEIGDVGAAMAKMQRAIRGHLNGLVQTEKMSALGQLSAGIAHEIRNPLFAVRNDLDFLQRNYCQDEEQREVYRSMGEGVQRISGIVSAVLGYARPHQPQFGRHSLSEVLRSTMALLGKQLAKEHFKVSIEVDEDVPELEVDLHKMEQVFVNLLTNAMRARSGATGQIRITARRVEEQVEVRVSDDGIGISAADLPRVFDPFFTQSGDGTGLGLTIVRRIIHQHHGSIEVQSEPGQGATFTFWLPVRQPQLEPSQYEVRYPADRRRAAGARVAPPVAEPAGLAGHGGGEWGGRV